MLQALLTDIPDGRRMTEDEAARLLSVRGRDVWAIAAAADRVRAEGVGEAVTWVCNQNLNVTNICVNACEFCGFSRKNGDPEAYFHSVDEVVSRLRAARGRGVTEICTVSGLHPGFTADDYIDLIRLIRQEAPDVHVHASNPQEVAYAAARSGMTTAEVLSALKQAGLGSLCGTAAEVLVDRVREEICPGKIDTAEWVRIITEAHRMGIPSTATLLYGHIETAADIARHLSIIREIQDDTGGFTEFVPLSFIPWTTPLYLSGRAPAGATGRLDVLVYAVARLFLDTVPHLQASWVKLGTKMAQVALMSGADDLGGTMYEESISKGAGAAGTDYLDPTEMRRIAEDIGRPLLQRTTLYAVP
ncbi:5-amino-6-(D-ribitylamino)uracil--L-tyrosine 4-hydroxyphenyl transferase CofH [Methanofollis fontis]|uniref:5-amino-6-(D-ribitylamino)uracil--L-tyrosine 4-hydroxyphenyl transferase n=1 Tax=Methanofollis fontis TaxID=2052832 RepID=A0A483CVY7_9EURY|nr:5-amino-6-(D-ribitylamino)uracil--L-tyrosine 4-hydroxyphenyl transferase CofH [Methanofollis fontis]TAJ45866.1 7,8-didemethyl-8-hydroxy-5-deazariboflavin synthase subunit CofH [Methanofollis fontis]